MQGGDLFLILFFSFIDGREPRFHLSQKFLALRLEFISPEALQLELVLQFIRQRFSQFGLAVLDLRFSIAANGILLCFKSPSRSFFADSPVLLLRSSISSLRAFLMIG